MLDGRPQTPETIHQLLGTADAPVLADIRIDEDFQTDPALIPGARRFRHSDWSGWVSTVPPDRPIVIICHAGLKLSQGLAARIRNEGRPAGYLAGGHLAWRTAGLACIPEDAIPTPDSHGRTQWVMSEKPGSEALACAWLIRRFVDRRAAFLFVEPGQVTAAAERFSARPLILKGEAARHSRDDTGLRELIGSWALSSPALSRLCDCVCGPDGARSAPEGAGLQAILFGLSRQCHDDLVLLDRIMPVLDALFRWCRHGHAAMEVELAGAGESDE